MRRLVLLLAIAIPLLVALSACSSNSGSKDDSATLKVGHHQIEGQNVFTVDENGNAARSMEKELVEKLAAEAGYSIRFVKIDTPRPDNSNLNSPDISNFFQALVDKLNDGSVDLVIGNLSILPKRRTVVDFIEPHLPNGAEGYSYPIAFVVKKENTTVKDELDAVINSFHSDGTIEALVAEYGVQ